MNDFTKEELEKIMSAIDGLVFSKFYAADTQAIYSKIQSMIDNYCDHEFIFRTDSPHFFMMCSKCDKIYVDDTFPG